MKVQNSKKPLPLCFTLLNSLMRISSIFYFLLLLLLVLSSSISASDVYTDALLRFKSDIVDHYNSLSDWLLPSSQPNQSIIAACSWSCVTCNSHSTSLIALDLSSKGLSGPLPAHHFSLFSDLLTLNLSHNLFSSLLPLSLFNLTNLTHLDISRNNFSGPFPSQVSRLHNLSLLDAFSNSFSGPLPLEVSDIQPLKVLNFAGSYFSGPIPSEYGNFRSLEFIHLAGNFLGGQIPPQLGRLQTMTHMEIGYNTYQGGIPWQISNMTRLRYLDIAAANLSGPIPKQLANLSNLESLFLFRNQLTGFIPSEFTHLVSLKSLDLSDNQISGSIPDSFSELKNLTLLSLFHNELSGSVPQAIAQLPMLVTLLLWDNYFSGSLPPTLGINSHLILVDVSTNNFNGSIPPYLCANTMLSKLILFSNYFTGELPPFLSNCSSLVRIRLEDNSLSGPISLDFNTLSHLSYLDLSTNNFIGGVPEDITKASKLEYFNVSGNIDLGGTLPTTVWSLPNLRNFSASSCNISGNIPSFDSCKSLSDVQLATNHLLGEIPETITDCKDLTIIDLSHNNLSGKIPEKLGHSTSLQLLNVSFNDISGLIPQDNTFKLMGSSAFVGNPKLCGLPLHQCRGSKEIQTEFLWVLILCIAVVVFIALAVSGVFYIHKGRRRSQWKMVSFSGLPKFTANDVLKSFDYVEFMETKPCSMLSTSNRQVTLPTGITVLVKKIEWNPQRMGDMEKCITHMGNARHKNLSRLLGYCYNNNLVYLLYDYHPNGTLSDKIAMKLDWGSKYKIVMDIARGLHFLHHECYPAIPHGDLRAINIVFNEIMEAQLGEFGFRFLMQLNKGSFSSTFSKMRAGESNSKVTMEELSMDIYNFGEMIMEIVTNGRVKSKVSEGILEQVHSENQGDDQDLMRKQISLVMEVASLCKNSRPSERPSMEDVMKLLSRSSHPI